MKKGFTLIELIIVIVLFSIIVFPVTFSFIVGVRSWESGKNRAYIRQSANLALEIMERDISRATSITDAAADEIEIEVDLTDDGTDETVNFNLDSDNNVLQRDVDGTTTILARDVGGFTLSYTDLNNDSMTIPQDVASQKKRDDIRIVNMLLDMSDGVEQITLSSSIYCRNQGLE